MSLRISHLGDCQRPEEALTLNSLIPQRPHLQEGAGEMQFGFIRVYVCI